MSTAPQPPRPTLEDLLRFKRAERPSPEFWAQFDRGLRQKQLTALMKRPQGWSRFRPAVIHGLRWAVPASAAAAAALVVVQMSWGPVFSPVPAAVASLSLSPVAPVAGTPSEPRTDIAPILASTETSVEPAAPTTSIAPPLRRSEAGEQQVATAVPLLAEQKFTWSLGALNAAQPVAFQTSKVATMPAQTNEPRRPRSSWTSRFSQMVQELGTEQAAGRQLQLASFSLPVDPSTAGAATPVAYVANANPGRLSDRDFRDLESRFGVTGSSLSVKF